MRRRSSRTTSEQTPLPIGCCEGRGRPGTRSAHGLLGASAVDWLFSHERLGTRGYVLFAVCCWTDTGHGVRPLSNAGLWANARRETDAARARVIGSLARANNLPAVHLRLEEPLF